jgi:hypothetical protein
MNAKFDLGKIVVKEDAAYALRVSGLDAAFFLEKHSSGDSGENDREQNERARQQGSMILSKYHTLRGHEILVATFPSRAETYLFCPPETIVKHVPLYDLACWSNKE